jgi:hypothetical protein
MVSCFGPPSAPILDGAQRLIIENGTYEFQVTNEDSFIVIKFDYYVSSGTCEINSYGINWRNGHATWGTWEPYQQLTAGVRYSINDRYRKRMWGDEVELDPVIILRGYEVGEYPEIAFTTTDTLLLR